MNTKRELSSFNLASGTEAFTNENLQDKWNLIFMGFASCPDMCPMTMNQMTKTAKILESEAPDLLQKLISLSSLSIPIETLQNRY
ncbi:MAG: hypothetical protein CM15mP22_2510 [Gammaproteobacteria bacterium]|nr:MAG: hypothetical protein CM15mP22_2510 [Gammaproteobacteria bacterium]